MKRIILMSLLALTACAKTPIEISNTNNPEVPVSLLFEKDQCKVYRFEDNGREHYFVKCEGASYDSTVSPRYCGKACTRDEEIITVPQ